MQAGGRLQAVLLTLASIACHQREMCSGCGVRLCCPSWRSRLLQPHVPRQGSGSLHRRCGSLYARFCGCSLSPAVLNLPRWILAIMRGPRPRHAIARVLRAWCHSPQHDAWQVLDSLPANQRTAMQAWDPRQHSWQLSGLALCRYMPAEAAAGVPVGAVPGAAAGSSPASYQGLSIAQGYPVVQGLPAPFQLQQVSSRPTACAAPCQAASRRNGVEREPGRQWQASTLDWLRSDAEPPACRPAQARRGARSSTACM